MAKSTASDEHSILTLSPNERDNRGVTDEEVHDVLLDAIEHGTQTEKTFTDCVFPYLDLDYRDIEGADNHPVVFQNCTFEQGVSADHADIKLPIEFNGSTFAGLSLDHSRFEYNITFSEATFEGEIEAFEARFDRDVDFTETTFEAPVNMDEATFDDDTRFTGSTFADDASFRAATFSGTSNDLEDHASFERTVFEGDANFHQTTFRFTTFHNARFGAQAHFEEAYFDGDVDFSSVVFEDEADFDEVDFGQDTTFEESEFQADAVFRGAEFEGSARALQDAARFVNVVFRGDTNFRNTQFEYLNFEGALFSGRAMFEEARFEADADFVGVVFRGEADFDEARFIEDADFSEARFKQPAVFRGAEFRGGAKHLEENALFARVQFDDDVDFDNATFTSANFTETRFGGVIDFTGAEFEQITFLAEAIDTDTYVNFTKAALKEGTITQPTGDRVRYDLTQASVGDVLFEAIEDDDRHDLLDYIRFCDTQFDEFDGYEFDFSAYTDYLDRNEWTLHAFSENAANYEYALNMTPEVIETTYLKAKNAASESGYIKAAGEFRVKRQQYARKKHIAIARDGTLNSKVRIKNASRAIENYFLGITCGHGMRLVRIIVVFAVAPILPALLYAFGGSAFRTNAGQLSSIAQLATPEGIATFYEILSFSYITFLTIGYGGIAPVGALARLLAGIEVYLSVILGGLVLYALIKRSEL